MSTEPLIETAETTETTEQPEAPASLAEFREQFPAAPKDGQPPPPESTSEQERKPKYRSKSHRALPEDVPEIAALTKQLREAEDAIKIDRKPGENDKVYLLRKRAEIAKLASARQAMPEVKPEPVREAPPAAVVAQPSAFTEKEPTLDQFASEADPYAAWQRALARYDRRKDAFEASQEVQKSTFRAQEETFNREINDGIRAHAQRAQALAESRPDVKALFAAEAAKPPQEQIQLTLAVRGAIEFHERGPEMVVALLQNPELADELFLLTTGRAVGDPRTDSLVATVRRRLLQRISGAPSGSPAPSRPVKLAPRPPNPERTVPQTPRDSSPSEAPGSLAAHRASLPTHLRH